MNSYIFSSVRFMIPSVIFTLVLLITFIFTIVVIFRQKRYATSWIINKVFNNHGGLYGRVNRRIHLATIFASTSGALVEG